MMGMDKGHAKYRITKRLPSPISRKWMNVSHKHQRNAHSTRTIYATPATGRVCLHDDPVNLTYLREAEHWQID